VMKSTLRDHFGSVHNEVVKGPNMFNLAPLKVLQLHRTPLISVGIFGTLRAAEGCLQVFFLGSLSFSFVKY